MIKIKKKETVQGLTYKVMESRAGDIRGRATLTGLNKITAGREGKWTAKSDVAVAQTYPELMSTLQYDSDPNKCRGEISRVGASGC